MVKPYQRIVSLVCIACETCECEKCNVEDLAKRIIDDVRADTIDEFANMFIEEGKKIKYLRHLWIESTCKKIAEQLKEQK